MKLTDSFRPLTMYKLFIGFMIFVSGVLLFDVFLEQPQGQGVAGFGLIAVLFFFIPLTAAASIKYIVVYYKNKNVTERTLSDKVFFYISIIILILTAILLGIWFYFAKIAIL